MPGRLAPAGGGRTARASATTTYVNPLCRRFEPCARERLVLDLRANMIYGFFGSSAIPHIGHLPGLLATISGCIGQA